MKRILTPLILILLAATLCAAADGIVPAVAFKLPFAVDGTLVVNRATFTPTKDGNGLLTVLYVKGDTIEQLTYTVTLKEGPAPDPDPNPDPDPDPDPNPDPNPDPPAELWGIVIEESSERTPEQAIVLASPEIRALFADEQFQVVDAVTDDGEVEAPADLKVYVDRAMDNKDKWPMLFLVSPKGDVYFEDTLPATVEATKKLVEKFKPKRGAK